MWKSVVTCCVGTVLLAASPVMAQGTDGPNRWGLAVSFAPVWQVPDKGPFGKLAEKSLEMADVGYDISGRDFRVGVVRGRDRRDDWGISLVHRTFKEDSIQGGIVKKCILEISCHVEGAELRYQDAALTGIEANRFVTVARIGNVVQVGVDLAAGLGWYTGKVERRDALNTFTDSSTEPVLGFTPTQVPASDLSKTKPSLLGRAEIAAAVRVTQAVKLRVSGGFNYPGTDVGSVSLMYFFGSNR